MPNIRCSYQLHIQLCDIKPAIWRRIAVSHTTTLAQLHRIIQAAMGWENRHLYAFEIAGQRYGMPDADWPEDPTMDARRYTLGQLLQGQALPMRYVYDFGDDWLHRIKVEAIIPLHNADSNASLALCLAGRNACPPEDCGGPLGFAHWQAQVAADDAKHFDLAAAQSRVDALQLQAGIAPAAPTAVQAPVLA